MEADLRAIFEEAIAEALNSKDPYECIIGHFACHSTRRQRGGRPPRKGVDIDERRRSLKDFITQMCVKDMQSSILLEDVQMRFNEHRRNIKQPRVSWNAQLLSSIDNLYGEKIFGLRWANEAQE